MALSPVDILNMRLARLSTQEESIRTGMDKANEAIVSYEHELDTLYDDRAKLTAAIDLLEEQGEE